MTSVKSGSSTSAAEIQRQAREAAEAAARQAAEAARRAAEALAKQLEQAMQQAQQARPSSRSEFQAEVKPRGPQLSADPTGPSSSLLTEDTRDGKANCLDQAADWLGMASPEIRARSEMVFLADQRPGAEGQSGHVVIRQGASVYDPASKKSYESMEAYLKEQPHYQQAGTLKANAAKRIFDTPPGSQARADALAREKVSPELQKMMVADSAQPPAGGTTQAPPTGAPQAQPAQQPPSYTQEQATKDAAALYEATEGGVTGWGTDEGKIFKTLEGKSPEQLDLIRKTYKDQYGKDLDGVIRGELSGNDKKKAEALLKGDGAKSDAVAIQAEMDGVFGSSEEILKTLEKKSPEERRAIAQKYAELNGGAPAGQSPEDFMLSRLEKELDKDQMARARNMLGVAQAKTPEEAAKLEAQAIKDGLMEDIGGMGTDEDRIFQRLEKATPEQRAILLQDPALLKGLKDDLSKEDYARAMGLLQGNSAQADAARIRGALDGTFGADEDGVRGVLEGKTPEQLEAIKAEYQKQTGKSLESEIRGWDGADKDVTLRLLNPPKEGDTKAQAEASAERIHLAIDGGGTDEDALRNELSTKSKAELDAITTAYKEKYGKDLRKELDSELDGRDQLEILDQMYDLGAVDPNDPNANQERVRRLREQQSQEKGFGSWVLDKTQNAIKGESDNDRLNQNLDRADKAIASGDTERATTLTGYATEDVKALQSSKDSLADGAATAAVVVATTAAVVATGGAATPLAIAGYAALGATTRAATYAAFQGDAAGAQELVRQGGIGAVEGATAVIPVKGAGALTSGAKTAGTTAAKNTVTTGAKTAGTTAARNTVTTGAKTGATTVAKETAGESVKKAAWQGVKEGAAGGAAGGAVDAATRSETWDNGVLNGLGDIAKRAALDGTIGAVTGGVFAGSLAKGADAMKPREIAVVRNPELTGSTTHVRYDNGQVRIEAGPRATDADIQAHLETARLLQRYEGPLGQIRQLKDRVKQAITSTPGYGTQGFESRLEVQKLQGILGELEVAQRRLDDSIRGVSGRPNAATVAEREALQRELDSVQSQLDTHASQVDSLAPGRGYVAKEGVDLNPSVHGRSDDVGQALDDLAARFTAVDGGHVATGGTLRLTSNSGQTIDLTFSPDNLYIERIRVGDREVTINPHNYPPGTSRFALDPHEIDLAIQQLHSFARTNASRQGLTVALPNSSALGLSKLPDLVATLAEGLRFPHVRDQIRALHAGEPVVHHHDQILDDWAEKNLGAQYGDHMFDRWLPSYYINNWQDRFVGGEAAFGQGNWKKPAAEG